MVLAELQFESKGLINLLFSVDHFRMNLGWSSSVCIFRAIIIRNGEIIPMSAEFTPESERQRLQFLVSIRSTENVKHFGTKEVNNWNTFMFSYA